MQNVNASRFNWNQELQLIMRFTVDESGKTTDFKMDPGSGNVEFDEMLYTNLPNGLKINGSLQHFMELI